jgi:hypothetical protein
MVIGHTITVADQDGGGESVALGDQVAQPLGDETDEVALPPAALALWCRLDVLDPRRFKSRARNCLNLLLFVGNLEIGAATS